ncbi:MAG: SDR family oxidoreductase [Pseudomonadota bacterium]
MKLALVTGGTQRLGAAIAARLAAEGWALALHYRSQPELDDVLAHSLAKSGVRHERFAADLVDAEAPQLLFEAAERAFETPITALVNSASMFGEDRLSDIDAETLQSHFLVNAAAPTLLAKELFARLPQDRDGAIVNLLDQRLAQPHGDNLAYTISKYALAGQTEILSRALAPRVRVNAVSPGLTLPTPNYDESVLGAARRAMPLQRLPTPEEVADAVAWLIGADSVTGQTIAVDGGARHVSFTRDFDRL